MFLTEDILNEGKVVINNTNGNKTRLSEGKSPKPSISNAKLPVCKSTKSQACVNQTGRNYVGNFF